MKKKNRSSANAADEQLVSTTPAGSSALPKGADDDDLLPFMEEHADIVASMDAGNPQEVLQAIDTWEARVKLLEPREQERIRRVTDDGQPFLERFRKEHGPSGGVSR